MKYVPNLIPEHSRVNLEGNYKLEERKQEKKKIWTVLSYIGAVFFLLGALTTIFTRFGQGIFLLIICLTLLPPVHQWIEKTLKFNLNWKIKTVFILLLYFSSLPFTFYYNDRDNKIAAIELANKKLKEEEEKFAKGEADKKEKIRIDSLKSYINKADQEFSKSKLAASILSLNSALKFANNERNEITHKRAHLYQKSGKYNEAINDYTNLINNNFDLKECFYQRAVCNNNLKKKQDAVNDLKEAMNLGNADAEVLYNKINPVKKRVAYYVTRCRDGSTSSAKGRGACSRHGGVSNWNEPVYEEYREF